MRTPAARLGTSLQSSLFSRRRRERRSASRTPLAQLRHALVAGFEESLFAHPEKGIDPALNLGAHRGTVLRGVLFSKRSYELAQGSGGELRPPTQELLEK